MVTWYEQIGSLVKAAGKPWFVSTLQGVLQTVFRYDYFLLVHFQKPRCARVECFDFPGTAAAEAMRNYTTGTHVIDPVYQLFVSDQLEAGVHDMADLSSRAASAVQRAGKGVANVVCDNDEEIGFRTVGWPKYLQETCLVVPLDPQSSVGISLFNCGLLGVGRESLSPLQQIFPALAPIIVRHVDAKGTTTWSTFSSVADESGSNGGGSQQNIAAVVSEYRTSLDETEIVAFFAAMFSVDVTWREADVMSRLLAGQTVAAIAHDLGISLHTIKTHRRNVYRKAGHGQLLVLMSQFHAWRVLQSR